MRKSIAAIVIAFSAVACDRESDRPTGPALQDAPANGVAAEQVTAGVRIVNGTNAPVAYVVYNKQWLGLLAPCSADAPCPTVAAGASVVVPSADIHGFADGAPLALRYWATGTPDTGVEVAVR